MHMLSLGYDCKVAYQIRRHSGQEQAFFFDWLMTPVEGLRVMLGRDEDLLRPGRWALVKSDSTVQDLDTGLMFMHEFPSVPVVDGDQSHRVIESQVEAHLPIARQKFAYLRRKTLELIRNSRDLLLVRADEVATLDEALQQINQVREIFLPLNPTLRFAFASTRLPGNFQAPQTLIFKTEPGADWRGDNASWDRMFGAARQLLHAPALAA